MLHFHWGSNTSAAPQLPALCHSSNTAQDLMVTLCRGKGLRNKLQRQQKEQETTGEAVTDTRTHSGGHRPGGTQRHPGSSASSAQQTSPEPRAGPCPRPDPSLSQPGRTRLSPRPLYLFIASSRDVADVI